ncbi:alcohol dehydrogenase catalytic domain-containing protein [Georgenia sp. Z1491]|uniref:alcohol dehydrogenase catalytic domain-containing protein n=1 Tax=Georgenia sp. Z1491 TaxID=3416707 RepID=UPI003CF6864D
MKIRGAVLEEIGRERPYRSTRPLTVSELELDGPGPDELLVRIEAAGVCHSDLSVIDGNRVRPVPMLLGHEAAGRIEQVGDGVDDLQVGQRVVLTFLPRCGDCEGCATDGRAPCVRGSLTNNEGTLLRGTNRLERDGQEVKHHLGVSAFATHAIVDRHSVVPVDDDVPPEVAAVLGCAVLTGGGAVVNAANPKDGDVVMVVGLGGVGMAALLTALAHAGVTVIGVDGVDDKLAAARALGAHETYSPAELAEKGVKASIVIEAAGNARAFDSALAATAPGGTTITVGLPSPDASVDLKPLGLVAQGRTIVGSYLGSAVPARDIPVFAQMWREGRLPVESLISSRITLDGINVAMDQLADGVAIRQIISFEDGATA